MVLTGCGGSPSASTSLLASIQGEAGGAPVDGIRCDTGEDAAFHIHAHLAVDVQGSHQAIPEGIGITPPRQVEQTATGSFVASGSCYYWLHTHARDGIIHIESAIQQTFTLGQLFDLWGRPLSSSQVGPARGNVVAFLNGDRYAGDPRTIPLTEHAVIQLDVGSSTPPRPFTFP
jgi:hypothetical protein